MPDQTARTADSDGLEDGGEAEDDLTVLGTLQVLAVQGNHRVVAHWWHRWHRGRTAETQRQAELTAIPFDV